MRIGVVIAAILGYAWGYFLCIIGREDKLRERIRRDNAKH